MDYETPTVVIETNTFFRKNTVLKNYFRRTKKAAKTKEDEKNA